MSAPSPEIISLTEAAERLDVHYMTAYRWVRTGLLDAHKDGGQWKVDASNLRAPQRRAAGRRPDVGGPIGADDLADVAQRLARRMLDGDESASWAIIDGALAQGLDASMLHLGLLGPAMQIIGDLWERGEISVGDEHRATAVANRIIGRLGPTFRRSGRPAGRVVLGTVEGDRHGLPVALLADLLRSRNIDVIEAGADLPALAYVSLLSADPGPGSVTAVALCATLPDNDHILPLITAIRSARPYVTILLGGAAIRDEATALGLGADVWTGATGLAATDAIEHALTNDVLESTR